MTPSRVAGGLAFLFDLDGVVIDSMPLHTRAWEIYLARHGIAPSDLATRMHGRRNDEIVAHFFGPDLAPDMVFSHGAAKETLFREMMLPDLPAQLVPGVTDFLTRYDDVPTGLASNAEPANIAFVLEHAGLAGRFDVVVDGHRVDRPKPFPDIYLLAAEQLGVAPRNCIVFEDSPTGIESASRAGARVVAVQTHPGELPPVDLSIRDFNDPALDPWLRSQDLRP